MKKKTLEELFDIVTLEYVEENPIEAYDLMQWMFIELNNRKNVIEKYKNLLEREREKNLLLSSIIESYKK